MPTPFTHLETAQRYLADEQLSPETRSLLTTERSAFLLGNIAADARVGAGVPREVTHFYAYDRPIEERPWRVMMERHPTLHTAHSPAQQAFLAGYVAHISIDEYWTLNMVRPYFVKREWNTDSRDFRFLMLHIILSYMDERDLSMLDAWQYEALCAAEPHDWLPFISDETLVGWRNFIGEQIAPGGESRTLALFAERIGKRPEELRAILDSPEQMQHGLWSNVLREDLARVEAEMYAFGHEQMRLYLEENGRGMV